jgi:hypothetical protein
VGTLRRGGSYVTLLCFGVLLGVKLGMYACVLVVWGALTVMYGLL